MSQKPKSILFPIVVIVVSALVLVGAMYLTQNNANTQRGAYFSGAKLLMQPTTVTANVGDEVPVQLWVQTDTLSGSTTPAKVSSVDTTFCYDAGFNLAGTSTASAITLNTEAFGSLEYIKDQNHCLRIVAVSSGIAPENLKSGMVLVASIKLKAVEAGTRMIVINPDESAIAGYNPVAGATDMTMKLGSVENSTYTIGGTGTPTPTPMANTANLKLNFRGFNYRVGDGMGADASIAISGGKVSTIKASISFDPSKLRLENFIPENDFYLVSKTIDSNTGKVVVSLGTSIPVTATGTGVNYGLMDFTAIGESTVNLSYVSDSIQVTGVDSQGNSTNFVTTSSPSETVNILPATTGPILKFRMSFLGIHNSAQCATAEKMPLTVIVRAADGTTKTITNLTAVRETYTDANALATYMVSIPLDNFNFYDNLSVFIKDARHLQVKYGVSGQSAFYNKAGGELSGLTSNYTTTPVFDFTKYPLLAGDVTGATSGTQDGVVDGLDFSYVKTQSIARTSVDAGGYMLADLNGNCKMESQDLSLLMLSLSEKQGQLY